MSIHTAKWQRCVEDVKAKGSAVNPFAVCTASIGRQGTFQAEHRGSRSRPKRLKQPASIFRLRDPGGRSVADRHRAIHAARVHVKREPVERGVKRELPKRGVKRDPSQQYVIREPFGYPLTRHRYIASPERIKREMEELPPSRIALHKLEEHELELAQRGEHRGAITRGWKASAPQRGRERRALPASCFMVPESHKFPICNKQGEIDPRG